MSPTVGAGPFGHRPSGHFDFEPPEQVTFAEVHPRRVRATKDGATVVDSERVRLVYRTGNLPRFAFPGEDVRVASEPEPAVEGYVTVAWDAVDARGRFDGPPLAVGRQDGLRLQGFSRPLRRGRRRGGRLVVSRAAERR